MEKVIIFSAPSGSGKTTIVHQLLKKYPQFEFSISATSRAPRGQEVDGVDYYFLTEEEFLRRIEADAFVEWEAVYAGTHYGTLKSEVEVLSPNPLEKAYSFIVFTEEGITTFSRVSIFENAYVPMAITPLGTVNSLSFFPCAYLMKVFPSFE